MKTGNKKRSQNVKTATGKLPESFGYSQTDGTFGLTEAQKKEQARNIKNWQSGISKPYYTIKNK